MPPSHALPATLFEALKHETRQAHERLEAHPRLARLLADDLAPAEYRALLARLYGFYAPVESRLAGHPALRTPGLRYEARRKAPLLARDLAHLGLPSAALDDLPRCAYVPDVATVPRAVGCLYVLEGATLGGQIITRHLRRSLGLAAGRGASFHAGYGRQTGPMWKAFKHAAGALVAPSAAPEAVAAAGATFRALHRWINDA